MRMDNGDEVSSIEIFITYEYDDNGNIVEYICEGNGKGTYVDAALFSHKFTYENNRLKSFNSFGEKNTVGSEFREKWEKERNYEYNDDQKIAKWNYSEESTLTWAEGQEIEEIVENGTYKFDIYGNTIEDTWYEDKNGEEINGKCELAYIATRYGEKEERSAQWSPIDLVLKKSNPWYQYDSCTEGTVIYDIDDKFNLIDFNGIQTWYMG